MYFEIKLQIWLWSVLLVVGYEIEFRPSCFRSCNCWVKLFQTKCYFSLHYNLVRFWISVLFWLTYSWSEIWNKKLLFSSLARVIFCVFCMWSCFTFFGFLAYRPVLQAVCLFMFICKYYDDIKIFIIHYQTHTLICNRWVCSV